LLSRRCSIDGHKATGFSKLIADRKTSNFGCHAVGELAVDISDHFRWDAGGRVGCPALVSYYAGSFAPRTSRAVAVAHHSNKKARQLKPLLDPRQHKN